MAYKCTATNYNRRLFREGETYSAIGKADPQFFVDLSADEAEGPVQETGLDDELQEVRDSLTELDVEFTGDQGLEELQTLLSDAQLAAMTA